MGMDSRCFPKETTPCGAACYGLLPFDVPWPKSDSSDLMVDIPKVIKQAHDHCQPPFPLRLNFSFRCGLRARWGDMERSKTSRKPLNPPARNHPSTSTPGSCKVGRDDLGSKKRSNWRRAKRASGMRKQSRPTSRRFDGEKDEMVERRRGRKGRRSQRTMKPQEKRV